MVATVFALALLIQPVLMGSAVAAPDEKYSRRYDDDDDGKYKGKKRQIKHRRYYDDDDDDDDDDARYFRRPSRYRSGGWGRWRRHRDEWCHMKHRGKKYSKKHRKYDHDHDDD
jgi:hypothetical protein